MSNIIKRYGAVREDVHEPLRVEDRVETPLSKIIKGSGSEGIEPYDFHEMQPSASTVVFPGQGVGKSPDPPADSVEEKDEGPSEEEREAAIRARLREAERRAQEIEKNAYEKGYAQGQKDGFEYGIKSASVVKEQLQALLNAMSLLPEQIHRDYRDWFVSASLAMAKKIVLQEIAADPGTLVRMIEDLLMEAQADQNMVIFISRKDHELLKKHEGFEAWMAGKSGSVSVKSDPGLKVGSCRLESSVQFLDASVETQLEMMYEFFQKTAHVPEIDEAS